MNGGRIDLQGRRRPTYLRVLVTGRCPMQCAYCHAEGEALPRAPGQRPRGPGSDVIGGCLEAAVRTGIRKFKFLGGEPLLRPDLPGIVEGLRRAAPEADLSLITGGVAPVENLERVFAAGLDRANLTIHGWGAEAFHRRGGTEDLRRLRDRNLEFLRRNGRPLKLNYVYSGPQDDEDLR